MPPLRKYSDTWLHGAFSPEAEQAIFRQLRSAPLEYPVRKAEPEKGPTMLWIDVTEEELGPKRDELVRGKFKIVNVTPSPVADWRIFYFMPEVFTWIEGQ